jgi:hypothetical protein
MKVNEEGNMKQRIRKRYKRYYADTLPSYSGLALTTFTSEMDQTLHYNIRNECESDVDDCQLTLFERFRSFLEDLFS